MLGEALHKWALSRIDTTTSSLFFNVLSLVLIVGLYRMGKNRTKKKGILTNYGVVAGRIEHVKNADYSDVIMGVSGVFNLRAQLNDALTEFGKVG